jgi:DNA ligase-4
MLSSFDETREKILANGGRITNELNDPKLTHIVLDDRDRSRRIPLMRETEL